MINLFKKAVKQKTIIHPDYKRLIEYVTTIEGRKLYKFKELADMPHGRYLYCTRFSTEMNMRLDAQTSQDIDERIMDYFLTEKPTKKDKRVAMDVLSTRMQMTKMLISGEVSYRLASCVYFWKDEDLTEYDFAIGDEKIELFKKVNFDDFFLTEPMKNFFPQTHISVQDLKVFSSQEKEMKKLLTGILKGKETENANLT